MALDIPPRRPRQDDLGLRKPPAQEQPPRQMHLLPLAFAWFAGVRLRTLHRAGSSKTFYSALGLSVVFLACLNGATLCVAVGYMVKKAPEELWWLGLGWFLLVSCALERLVLQVSAKTTAGVVAALVPRLLVSFMFAISIAEPAMLKSAEDRINAVLSHNIASGIKRARADLTNEYEPKIKNAKQEIDTLRKREKRVANNVERYRVLASSECRDLCDHYSRMLRQRKRDERAMLDRHIGRIRGLKSRIHNLRTDKRTVLADRIKSIRDNTGLPARREALAALMKRYPSMNEQVWFLRLFFLFLDLLPLSIKLARGRDSYTEQLDAERKAETAASGRTKAEAEIESFRIARETESRKRIIDHEVSVNEQKEMDGAEGIWYGGSDDNFTRPARGEHVDAWDLETFIDNSRTHGDEPVDVPPELRRGGLFGLASLGTLALVTTLLTTFIGHSVAGTWLVLLALLAAGGVAVFTHGFRRAPQWALRAIFITLISGIVLPLVIVLINI